MKDPSNSGARPSAALVLATGSLWLCALVAGYGMLGPLASWMWLAAYVALWALVGWKFMPLPSLRRTWVLLLLAAAVGLLLMRRTAWIESEGLAALGTHLGDRARLEWTPSIAPPLVRDDRPQRFYVHAPNGERVRVRLGPGGATLDSESLGEGLFRVDYNPRQHGAAASESGNVQARIEVDGAWSERSMRAVITSPHPRWFCASPSRSQAATVSEETDELLLVTSDGRVRSVRVGDGPTDCEYLDESRIAISHRHGSTLWIVDASNDQVLRRLPARAGTRLAIDEDRQTLAMATASGVAFFTAPNFEMAAVRPVAVDAEAVPDWLEFVAGGLVVSSRRNAALYRMDRADDWASGAPLLLGRPAVTMAKTGDRVVVATTDYRPNGDAHLGNHFVQDQLLFVDVANWVVDEQVLAARRSVDQRSAGDVDRGVSPMGIEALEADRLRIVFAGTDEVWTTGDALPSMMPVEDLPAPHGIVTFANGSFSVSSPSSGAIGTYDGSRWRVVEVGDGDHLAQEGERAFYEATRAGISCQSCHLHADTDFVLRNIGGQRLAPTLGTGGLMGTSPYLRDGSYPEIRDLDHLAQTLFRGYLRRVPARGQRIEHFVEALPRRSVVNRPPNVERSRRGVQAFVKARCVLCHSFPAFTNLGQLPLATLFPNKAEEDGRPGEVLDTPSLLSVGTHAPYLNDGRASTLRNVLTEHNARDSHGATSSLNDQEIDDLIFFLERL